MKEVQCQDENVVPEIKQKGKNMGEKFAGRAPLSNTTNKQSQKSEKRSRKTSGSKSQLTTPGGSIARRSASGHQGFVIFEDKKESADGRPGPSRPTANVQTQTESPDYDAEMAASDLCAEVPSDQYWRRLAASRQEALDSALAENEQLHEQLAQLQEHIRLLEEVAQRAEDVMASVQEWSEEQGTGTS